MLVHLGQNDTATVIRNAWLKTIEDGIHTGDIYNESVSKQRVNTQEFAQAVVEHLGQKPYKFRAADFAPLPADFKKPSEYIDLIKC